MGYWKKYFNDLICQCAPDNGFAQDAIEDALQTDPTLQVTGKLEIDAQKVMARYDHIMESYRRKLKPTPIQPITYPARPVNGGPLEKAPAKAGRWFYEPKYNGWRAIVHTSSGRMFNRYGRALSIAQEFAKALALLQQSPFVWLDCEALERRHGLGRGTLIVLDVPVLNESKEGPRAYEQRRALLTEHFQVLPTHTQPEAGAVYLAPSFPWESAEALPWYHSLQRCNREWNSEFYEGVVAKRADSLYPVQFSDPAREFPFWVKHRWHW